MGLKSTIIDPPERDLFQDPKRAKLYLSSPQGWNYISNKVRNCDGALHNTPQAILKITSYSGGVTATRKYINYISNKSEYGLEDEAGYKFTSEKEIEELLDQWKVDFSPSQKNKIEKIKLTFNVLNLNKKELYQDIKEFAEKNYSDNTHRIDVGRSKNKKNQITLTIHNDADIKLNKDEIKSKVELEYKKTFKDIETVKNRKRRDVVNLMVSSPVGTDPKKLLLAARAFAKDQLRDKGYQYVFALHTKESHEKNPENPHVHFAIKLVDENGIKLDPRKNIIHKWRERYAEYCRANEIEVIASRKYERGLVQKGQKREFIQMKKRGVTPEVEKNAFRKIKQAYLRDETKLAWEIAIKNRSNMEREELRVISAFLKGHASKLSDNKKQEQCIRFAKVVEGWQKRMPVPQTKKQEIHHSLDLIREQKQVNKLEALKEIDIDLEPE